jgi:hypothetical protein
VRDETVPTAAGPIAVTVNHRRRDRAALCSQRDGSSGPRQRGARCGKGKRRGSFFAYQPNLEREALRRDNMRATDDIVT